MTAVENSPRPAWARRQLLDAGFVVIPGPVPDDRLAELSASYDAAVRAADPSDVRVGSTTTRVSDFVNRGPEFDGLYLYPPLLDAAAIVIDGPFKLSTMHARAVRPGVAAQTVHVDFARDAAGWPMVGFIQLACGPAGSMILFNGSIWHGQAAHGAAEPRRSIQGAYIRRDAESGRTCPRA